MKRVLFLALATMFLGALAAPAHAGRSDFVPLSWTGTKADSGFEVHIADGGTATTSTFSGHTGINYDSDGDGDGDGDLAAWIYLTFTQAATDTVGYRLQYSFPDGAGGVVTVYGDTVNVAAESGELVKIPIPILPSGSVAATIFESDAAAVELGDVRAWGVVFKEE